MFTAFPPLWVYFCNESARREKLDTAAIYSYRHRGAPICISVEFMGAGSRSFKGYVGCIAWKLCWNDVHHNGVGGTCPVLFYSHPIKLPRELLVQGHLQSLVRPALSSFSGTGVAIVLLPACTQKGLQVSAVCYAGANTILITHHHAHYQLERRRIPYSSK